MTFDVVTLFPGVFVGPLAQGVLGRARKSGAVAVRVHDLRRWGVGPARQVDDATFGGGGGMVLRPEPLFEAVDWLRRALPSPRERVVLLSPQGEALDHASARRLAGYDRVILICGRYEGVDERVREGLADEELRVGDAVLAGGEVPAMAVVEAASRFVPGVLGRSEAADRDSFENDELDFPHYTRPASYRGMDVPAVLLSGDHGEVERWRSAKAREVTLAKRPDLTASSIRRAAPEGRARGRS